ncbi:hypothetical protein L3i23_15330 [Herbiconiux sp. L3-i23]|nr:hypothetical protein L3i23_15330 [Herbiconiux sp. L3-i23]
MPAASGTVLKRWNGDGTGERVARVSEVSLLIGGPSSGGRWSVVRNGTPVLWGERRAHQFCIGTDVQKVDLHRGMR